MNETIRQLWARKSVRVFQEKDIDEATRTTIVEAAIQAPTAGNQVLYTIIDVRDAAKKQALAQSCDNQPFIATAPMVLVFAADCRRWHNAYLAAGIQPRAPGVGDLLLAVSDANIAAQNAVVAAEALGLGSCYIGDIMEQCELHQRLLNLPEWVFPAAMLVVGWPTKQQTERKKPVRFNKEYIVHRDAYTPLTDKQLRAMFAEVHPEDTFDFDRYISAFCKRKYESEFSREMTRSVAEYLRQFAPFAQEDK